MHVFMKLSVGILAFLFAPMLAHAHAVPVEMQPVSGSAVEAARELSIRFSERLEAGSSNITVREVAGELVETPSARVAASDPRLLTLALPDLEAGQYIVTWGVVSEDDGHYTRGSYAFSIGTEAAPVLGTTVEIVRIATVLEAFYMLGAFVGNGIFLGVLLLFALVCRPLLNRGRFTEHRAVIVRGYLALGVAAALFVLASGAAQVVLKSLHLADLHAVGFGDALAMFLNTTAGTSMIVRSVAAAVAGMVCALAAKRIVAAPRFTVFEGIVLACLLVFAYFRAIVSHATANAFFPDVSVAVNMLHLVEKDVWFGALVVLLCCYTAARSLAVALVPRVFTFLALNVIGLSLTASYIIWLHLKSFTNLLRSEWGSVLIELLAAAVLVALLRAYHMWALRYRPHMFSRTAFCTLALETGAYLLVLFYSAVIINTSPPLSVPPTETFRAESEGIAIMLAAYRHEADTALLTVRGGTTPVAFLGAPEDGVRIDLARRFDGGYTFPLNLIANRAVSLSVVVPQEHGYDGRATFDIEPDDFTTTVGHGRAADGFALALACAGVLFAALGAACYRFGRALPEPKLSPGVRILPVAACVVAGAAFAFFAARGMSIAFQNEFKQMCIADGHAWHMMQPMRNGVVRAPEPQEGCMLADGRNHFTDYREYRFLRSLAPAAVDVVFAPGIGAGAATEFQVRLTEADGTPAILGLAHERWLHTIIISEDMSHFAHIHPSDRGVLSDADIARATFTLAHTFPRAGRYMVAFDYQHGLRAESTVRIVEVAGGTALADTPVRAADTRVEVDGYTITLDHPVLFAASSSTLQYRIERNGTPVDDLEPYLGAAMHLAAIKHDLSAFIHAHGEVHPEGQPVAPTAGHVHAPPPARFGPDIEAHLTFPSPGIYTVFSEFKHAGVVVPAAFTVRVEGSVAF